MPAPSQLRSWVLLILAAACWGAGTVVSKQAVSEVPPLTLLAAQLAASVLFLLLLARARGERPAGGREARLLGRLGLLNPGIAYALSLIGLAEITASLSVLLWAAEPILILALAALVLGERVGVPLLLPTAAAIGGLVLVVLDPATSGSLFGVALTLAGVAACAVYSVAARRWLLGSDSTFGIVLAQQAHALGLAVLVVAGVAVVGGPVLPDRLSPAGLVSVAASGLLYYGLAYSFYLAALRRTRASVAASSFYLVPVFGLAGGWLVGERLEPLQWLGAAIVVGAVFAITLWSMRVSAPELSAQPSRAAASAQIAMTPSDSSRR